MKLEWSERARRDLAETASFIAKDSPAAAKRWVEHIRRRAKQAIAFPHGARQLPNQEDENIRELIDGNYHVVYQIQPEKIVLVTVYERHRRTPTIRDVRE